MRVFLNEVEPIETLAYQVVAQGGKRDEFGNRVVENAHLPIYLGTVKGSKIEGIEYLIVTSDLQGNVREGAELKLLGEVLPEFLQMLFEMRFPEVNKERVCVCLCGDLYANLEKRGGLGDVKHVWRAFKKCFGHIVGVAGNHDDFGAVADFEAFKKEAGIYYLHNQIVKIGNLKVGGIGGIIGRSDKPFRNEEEKHLADLKKMLLKEPHYILLHEGPSNQNPDLEGNDQMRIVIEGSPKNTIFCGHSYWKQTIVDKGNGTQVINVDAKCLILKVENGDD